ncbi:sugar kinase [Longimycelium tulufanense]|uniref:Sugar kinase n=1 Tax=Longimycelium tulufanense TaxID=907463 RepID=A0A8J3CI23_9PSEU|nr:sugar kinase [Longimycelium tulufanense]GGM70625.1 sugar kinase [Longimycelium tulufanense]
MRADGAVACLGEAMAVFVPEEARNTHRFLLTVGGAEANVARHLARLGITVRWLGAVGADDLGATVLASLRDCGVDVTSTIVDPSRPTALYVKESAPTGSRMRYYRTGSACSALGPELLDTVDLSGIGLLHLTGITATLSASCLDLLRVVTNRRVPDRLISFDVNWRPTLWRGKDHRVLTELANAADVVFVGEDEAEALWGDGAPSAVRTALPDPPTVVVKHGARGATLLEDGPTVFQPGLAVDVVEPIGAGDAFAAGFLAATLAGAGPRERLRRGHIAAAAALRSREDVGEPLPPDLVATLLAADPDTWAAARIGSGTPR